MTNTDEGIALVAVLAEQEDERRDLGHLLHDRPLQLLAAASMQLDALLLGDAFRTEENAPAVEEIRAVQARIRAAGGELRDLVGDLVPLVEVASLARVLERRLAGLAASPTVAIDDVALSPAAALALVRAADDLIGAGPTAWRAVGVHVVDDRVVLQATPSASALVAIGPLVARLHARCQPFGGWADATEGPEGPSIAATLPLG
jgi:hypothetical protein